MSSRVVVFSHGLEGAPTGAKITALAAVARRAGYEPVAVDYRGINQVAERVNKLLDACGGRGGELILVGSSLGAYLSVASAARVHARALFLMAPALYLNQLPPLEIGTIECPIAIVHGLHDEVVPFANSIRFAEEYRATLHLVQSDHQLQDQIPFMEYLFEYFLNALASSVPIT